MSSSPDTAYVHGSTEESGGEGGPVTTAGGMVHASQINDADVLFGRGGKSNPGNAAFRQLVADRAEEYSRVKRARKTQISRQLIDEVASRGGRFLVAVKDGQAPKGGKLSGGGEGEGGDPTQPQWKVAKWWKVATDAVAMEKAKQSLRDTAAKDAPAKSASSGTCTSSGGGATSSSGDASPAKQGKKKKQTTKRPQQPPQHPPQKQREVVKTSLDFDEISGFVTATATTTTTTTTITTTTTRTTTTVPEAPSVQLEVQDFEEILNLLSDDDEDGNVEQALEECLGGGDISVNLSAAAEELLHQSPTPLPYSPTDDPPSIRTGGITRSISSGKSGGGTATSSSRAADGASLPSSTAHAAVSPVDSFAPTAGVGCTISPLDNTFNIMPPQPPCQQINRAMMPNAYYQQRGDGQNGSGSRASAKPIKSRTIATGRIANDDEDLQKILGWFREDEKAESPGISSATDAESESYAGGSSGYYSESSSASISSPSHASASHSQSQMGGASGYITSPGVDSPPGGQMHNGGVDLSFPHLQPIAEGMAMPLPSTGIPTNNLSPGAMPGGVAPCVPGVSMPPVPQDTFTRQELSMAALNNSIGNGMPIFASNQQQQQQQPILNSGFIQQKLFQQQQLLQQQQPMNMNQSLPAFDEQPNLQSFQQHQRANPNTTGVQQGAPKRARYEEPAPTTDRLAPLYEWGTELDEVTQNCLEYSLPVTLPALSWLLGYSRAGIWFCILTVVFHTLESAITNFGPRTQRFRFPFAPLDQVTHMLIDSGII